MSLSNGRKYALLFLVIAAAIPAGLWLFSLGAQLSQSYQRQQYAESEEKRKEKHKAAEIAYANSYMDAIQARNKANELATKEKELAEQGPGKRDTGWGSTTHEQLAALVQERRFAVSVDTANGFGRMSKILEPFVVIGFSKTEKLGGMVLLGQALQIPEYDNFGLWMIKSMNQVPSLLIHKGGTSTDDLYGLTAAIIRGPGNALVCHGPLAWLIINPAQKTAMPADRLAELTAICEQDAILQDGFLMDLLKSRPLHSGRLNPGNSYSHPWYLGDLAIDPVTTEIKGTMTFPTQVRSIAVHGSISKGVLTLTPDAGVDLAELPMLASGFFLALDDTRGGLAGYMSTHQGWRRCWIPVISEHADPSAIATWNGAWTGTVFSDGRESIATFEIKIDPSWCGSAHLTFADSVHDFKIALTHEGLWCLDFNLLPGKPFLLPSLKGENVSNLKGSIVTGASKGVVAWGTLDVVRQVAAPTR